MDQADFGQVPLLAPRTMLTTDLKNLVADTESALLGKKGPSNSSSTAASPFKIDRGNVRTLVGEALPTPPPILNYPANFPVEKSPEIEQEKAVIFQDFASYNAPTWTPPETLSVKVAKRRNKYPVSQ